MKSILFSGVALALLTGGALAQATTSPTAPAAPPPTPTVQTGASTMIGRGAPPPPAMPDETDADAGAPPPPPPPGGPRGGHPPQPPKSAHFVLQRGDTALDVKCADDEAMKACSDIALQLLDKLAILPKL